MRISKTPNSRTTVPLQDPWRLQEASAPARFRGGLKPESELAYRGTTSQAAEKLARSLKKRQGTTSVVPQAGKTKGWALAPEDCNSGLLPSNGPFSAACEVVL